MFRRFAATSVLKSTRAFSATMPRMCCDYIPVPVAAVTAKAPSWKANAVVNGQVKSVSLEDYAGKYVVMLFYPLDFTFVCPTEIISFSERSAEFEKIGAQVIAISVDSEFSHLAWINTPRKKGGLGEMKIPVVADLTKNISREYGVLLEEKGIALRGLFIIDGKGVLRSMTVNDLPVGRSVDEALRVVQAFQYNDEHGEVVPCNWKPGDATIKPAKASEYFEKNN
eukprot:GILI01014819.1.p1 GENE.GILI01014819.1~~GILI01014819.1.p1  ORF type:complete len:236 (-),score=74.48 GILI01014819.1:51-725(-)